MGLKTPGRPKGSGKELRQAYHFRLSKEQADILKKYGGGKWIRAQLNHLIVEYNKRGKLLADK